MVRFEPRVRGSFSDRNKLNSINTVIQKDDLDERTINRIINIFDDIIDYSFRKGDSDELYDYIYKCVFCVTSDEMPMGDGARRQNIIFGIKNNWEYHEIFSFLESVLGWYNKKYQFDKIYVKFNNFFEEECVGYRFIDGKVTDIDNEEEINEIDKALNTKYSACNKCISKALSHLYDRKKPDYSNSVKESISAIEAMCSIILGTRKPTLGATLKELKRKGLKIHPAMEKAFLSLYGYASDKSGIRHNNGLDENTTFEEAKYMLVSCSAFLNYLIQIYEKFEK